ncbi:NFACT RNA binding domain-containing protein [Hymenobacter sp. 15J16-1T3B]|uniref:NFACT RNA binding domain-containing protein n=1 Tax=Hymenobacter sp. 15J16-1T3B TaxID=2886941 RepID=UPI001D105AB9|nr:NFACT RNA binding domain-containing protein [Hymenobacter sp. 15J16-1T3B]MCC3159863.1 NFACT RNA binding domain-containing protein [Hymenobacter sp. 15J16-1T3B]
MHNNYYFLRLLAPALSRQLAGCRVTACFSQEKDELVVGLLRPHAAPEAAEWWLKVRLAGTQPLLSLPESFHRARQNSVDLLPELLGQEVEQVSVLPNDRVLQLHFRSGGALWLKLFGPHANAVFYPAPAAPAQLFQQRFTADAGLREVPIRPEPSPAHVAAHPDPARLYPTLGEVPRYWLRQRGYDAAPPAERLALLQAVLALLAQPSQLYIVNLEGRTRLSLLPVGEVEQILPPDPVAALRAFVPLLLGRGAYEGELRQLRQSLEKRADEAATSASMARRRLYALEHEASYRQTADLIMANLHQIPAGAAQVEVLDFYQNDQPRLIKLKPSETPQRTAQNLYRKAKNQQIEQQQLRERADRRETEALWCLERLEELAALPDLRQLRAWRKQHGLDPAVQAKAAASELPFKVFEDSGFTILVGRNAQNNDLLTQRYAHKDDLWLHAKDVSGSHVVIRQRPGHAVPTPVVERAAQLAAWYSRRQNDSLCPVTVTPKKFVRKPRGAAPGQVVVEREKVMLVVPANPFERAG